MSPLRIIGPASIEVWISSPVRSRKPVLMKTTRSLAARMHSLRLTRGAPLLVHDAHLERVARQAERVLDAPEELDGEGDLVRPVHLRLDDVDASRRGLLRGGPPPPTSCSAISAVTMRVHDALRHLVAVAVEDRVGRSSGGRHCAPASGAAGQRERRRRPAPYRSRSGLSARVIVLAALLDLLGQVALHQAEPVAVDGDLVLGVDGGDRILASP